MIPRLRRRRGVFAAGKQKIVIVAPFGEGVQRAGLGVLFVCASSSERRLDHHKRSRVSALLRAEGFLLLTLILRSMRQLLSLFFLLAESIMYFTSGKERVPPCSTNA